MSITSFYPPKLFTWVGFLYWLLQTGHTYGQLPVATRAERHATGYSNLSLVIRQAKKAALASEAAVGMPGSLAGKGIFKSEGTRSDSFGPTTDLKPNEQVKANARNAASPALRNQG